MGCKSTPYNTTDKIKPEQVKRTPNIKHLNDLGAENNTTKLSLQSCTSQTFTSGVFSTAYITYPNESSQLNLSYIVHRSDRIYRHFPAYITPYCIERET